MSPLLPLLLTILLPAAQEPAAQQDPQQAFRAWAESLADATGQPLFLDYRLQAEFRVTGLDDETSSELAGSGMPEEVTAEGRLVYSIPDAERMRLDLTLQGAAPSIEMEFAVDGSLLLDGRSVWVFGSADLPEMEPATGSLRVTQSVAEEAYGLLGEFLKQASVIDPSLSALEAITWPPTLTAYFHPASWTGNFDFGIQCRSFQREGPLVRTRVGYDLSEDGLMRQILLSDVETEEEREAVEPILGLLRDLEIAIDFDAATGVPLSTTVDLEIPLASFEEGLDGSIMLKAALRVEAFDREPHFEEGVFRAPAGLEPFEADPFLRMGIAQMRAMLDEAEAEEDLEF